MTIARGCGCGGHRALDWCYHFPVSLRDRLSNRTLFLLYSGYFAFFFWIGWRATQWLAALPHFAPYKVYNFVGQVYGVIGVILLTPLLIENERFNRIIVGPVAEWFHAVTTGVLCGVMVASALAPVTKTAIGVTELLTPALFLMLFVNVNLFGIFLFEQRDAFAPKWRAKIFGGIVLGVGLGLQLLGAWLDLRS
jgi:hypothetical protein